jgi:hypothetical protein
MELLPSMEQNYKHLCDPGLRLVESNGKISFQVTDAARPWVLKIHDRFKNAHISLIERLGEANWQRFVRVRQNMEAGDCVHDVPISAHSTFLPASKFYDSGLGSSIRPESSFARTDASYSSFVSSFAGQGGSCARVPPTPSGVVDGTPFQCFICKCMLSKIRNRVQWK